MLCAVGKRIAAAVEQPQRLWRELDAGVVVRERGRRIREIAQRLSRRFRESQIGTVRSALTIDDGTTAVTDNYLRVPVAPARPRNEWVQVVIQ